MTCCGTELVVYDGMMMCTTCYRLTSYLVDADLAFGEPPPIATFFPYKRINHFKEILSQVQGKESSKIPEKVMMDLKHAIETERLQPQQLTTIKMRKILKKLGHNRFYEHVPLMKSKLGIRAPTMTQEVEETMCNLFLKLQSPYASVVAPHRMNFLSYHFTLYKLCELLDERQCLENLPLFKNKNKLREQDMVWKKMCEIMDWQFVPTI